MRAQNSPENDTRSSKLSQIRRISAEADCLPRNAGALSKLSSKISRFGVSHGPCQLEPRLSQNG